MDDLPNPVLAQEDTISESEKYPTPKPNNHIIKTMLLIFGVIIVLIIFAGGSYSIGKQIYESLKPKPPGMPNVVVIATPTMIQEQNPPGLKTYNGPIKFTTSNSPFSFNYPQGWVEETSLRHMESTYIEDVISNGTSDLSKRYQLTVDTIRNDASSLQEFIAQHQAVGTYPNLSLNTYVKDTTVTIENTDWLIDRDASGEGANESVILLKGNTVVLLTCTNCGDAITNQILSTFTFTQ